jgi:hypothetical protein
MLRPRNEDVKRYGRAVRAKPGITSVLLLPVGWGIKISRFDRRALAYGNSRRLDRSAKRGAEQPSCFQVVRGCH